MHFQKAPGSQGSLISDPRRLRRWLREMEDRTSKLPSLKEAMKLSADELNKYSAISSVSNVFIFFKTWFWIKSWS